MNTNYFKFTPHETEDEVWIRTDLVEFFEVTKVVFPAQSRGFQAHIKTHLEDYLLGRFDTKEEAVALLSTFLKQLEGPKNVKV